MSRLRNAASFLALCDDKSRLDKSLSKFSRCISLSRVWRALLCDAVFGIRLIFKAVQVIFVRFGQSAKWNSSQDCILTLIIREFGGKMFCENKGTTFWAIHYLVVFETGVATEKNACMDPSKKHMFQHKGMHWYVDCISYVGWQIFTHVMTYHEALSYTIHQFSFVLIATTHAPMRILSKLCTQKVHFHKFGVCISKWIHEEIKYQKWLKTKKKEFNKM